MWYVVTPASLTCLADADADKVRDWTKMKMFVFIFVQPLSLSASPELVGFASSVTHQDYDDDLLRI